MLGCLGWEVWLPGEEGSGGFTVAVIGWAWRSDGEECRAVVCTTKGPQLLTDADEERAEFRQVRLV
jgi:hypothetical protein